MRQALRALLREQVLPQLNAGMVRPFMPVLMAHMSRCGKCEGGLECGMDG